MDDEVRRLLIDEPEKHRAAFVADMPFETRRRALHSMKGSFGVANERDVADAFARLERRLIGGDADVIAEAARLMSTSLASLRAGGALAKRSWPEPPDDLRPSVRDPTLAEGYVSSIRDRLAQIDAALSSDRPGDDDWLTVFREVHTIKGGALAVGDEVMAWFCHGLEEHLRPLRHANAGDASPAWVDEAAHYRSVMSEILESPEHGLATLRLVAGGSLPSVRPPIDTPLPLPPKRPTLEVAGSAESRGPGDDSVRVATATLERLFERATQLAQIGAPIAGNVFSLERGAQRANDIHRALREALRLIGPPRPWGAPALAIAKLVEWSLAVNEVAMSLEKAASELRHAATRVGREGAGMQATVTSMRTTQAARLFERIATATYAQARREGKEVRG